MDARPQRPLRSLHVTDENTAPHSKPSLHQRHKSTGTLSTLLGQGGLKMAAKRTAFGDVSNVVKNTAARDDLVTINKPAAYDVPQKPQVPTENHAALTRPAQRPANLALSRNTHGIASNSASTVSIITTVRQSESAKESHFPAPMGRTLSKRAKTTAIYKDTTAAEYSELELKAILPATSTISVNQSLGPRHHKSYPHFTTHLAGLPSKPIREDVVESEACGAPQSSTDARPNDAHYEQSLYESVDVRPAQVQTKHEALQTAVLQEISAQLKYEEEMKNRELPPLPPVSEPEEYWDEEEEEIYDEQGYTTAHSYRSRGDNTTSGATTVLFPRVNNKVKKELAIAKEFVESSRTQEDIEDEAWDTSMVAEYGDEIFSYMRELEIKMLPNPHYMDNQAEIQWSMRAVLMDWLIQVHHRFSLLPETLFLCVNYIDRFLSCKIVSLGKLQLVGATAIFVAAKYEEINCPSVAEIVYMVDGGYTVDEILKAERFMLSMLQFELGWPGPMSFLRRVSKADEYDLETRTLAKYFLEVTIMDERFVGSPPSYVAAGAHCLARTMLKKGDWTAAHIYYSGYTWTQLKPLLSMMIECCEQPDKHHAAVFDKYSDRRYKRAAVFVKAEMEKGFVLPATSVNLIRMSPPSTKSVSSPTPFAHVAPYEHVPSNRYETGVA